MQRTFRKLSHADFRQRVKVVDPAYYRWGDGANRVDHTRQRPVASALMGFGWAYLTITIANNREMIESSLQQGNLPVEYHSWVFSGLAAFMGITGVMLALHLARYLLKSGGKKRNSGGILLGALGAMILVYTPASVWQTGMGMLDDNSRGLMMQASATVEEVLPNVDFGKVTFVSSQGR
ncbi:hypothetical protein [Tropicibacter alexandrii]|uniref:hypothetical protein n=1 Tax=Tropicibacter alexandrii TaxID=2267683 RepID=UPI000EF469C7|nr:hypothetical protein [Tropicibacter alexandrii]